MSINIFNKFKLVLMLNLRMLINKTSMLINKFTRVSMLINVDQ